MRQADQEEGEDPGQRLELSQQLRWGNNRADSDRADRQQRSDDEPDALLLISLHRAAAPRDCYRRLHVAPVSDATIPECNTSPNPTLLTTSATL